jgi:hypothetical protein
MKLTDKEEKLLRLALDTAAADGEWRNCAHKLLRSWRERRVLAEDVVAVPSQTPPPPPPPPRSSGPDYGLCTMPWGKHKGKSFRQIPPDYLAWALRWIREDATRARAMASLATSITRFLADRRA